MTDLAALSAAATAAPWVIAKMNDGAFGVIDDGWEDVARLLTNADAALIVALRNAYANGDLVEREKVKALVAVVEAAQAFGLCPFCGSRQHGRYLPAHPHQGRCPLAALDNMGGGVKP